jgi:hypothetical protein
MTRMFVPAVALAIASVSGSSAMAQATADTAVTVKFGGFVDGYYAYDFNRPAHTRPRLQHAAGAA